MTKILIVDDEPKNLYLLQVLLSASGFELELASNGAEALELARRAPPDVVVSDILMPVMDGFALCHAWKDDERLRDILFIFYTATYTDPKDEAFALSLGADRFIIKPVEPDKFLALLKETMQDQAAGKLAVPFEPIEEAKYYKEYNVALIRKLEDKVLQLEQANRALELDITRQEQAEKALNESEERFRSLFENSTIGLYRTMASGAILLANPTLVRMLGYGNFDELAQRNLEQEGYTPEYSRSQFRERIEREGELKGIEVSWIRKDGSHIYARESAKAIRDMDGKVLYYEGTVEDITERKQAEARLAQEESLLQNLMETIPDLIYFKDEESRIIRINRAQAVRLGLTDPAQALGKTDFDFFSEEHARSAYEDEQRIIQTGIPIVNLEERETWPDRPDTWVLTTKMPLADKEGRIVGTYGISRDISERKYAEEAQHRAEEKIKASLAEKEVLLKEIHHRVKNNLAIVSSLLEMQARRSQDEHVRNEFQVSQQRILAMAQIHEQLYRSQNLAQINMAEYVAALTNGLRSMDILSNVVIKVEIQDVNLDIDQAIPCGLIINELLTNALKSAFSAAGIVSGQHKEILVSMHSENGCNILKVSDNGAGLPDGLDVKHTKTLGLRLVNRLTDQLEGTLEVESSQAGAVFTITFPVQT